MNRTYSVNVPITNLRRTNSTTSKMSYQKDSDQESQLLYNETVKLIEMNNNGAYVEAQEQLHKGASWYRGWLPMCDLLSSEEPKGHDVFVTSFWAKVKTDRDILVSFGTGFKKITETEDHTEVLLPGGGKGMISNSDLRKEPMVSHARKFLGTPYLWGGRSAFDPKHKVVSGVDCSGLVNLLYRVEGVDLPRNAVDQWKQCSAIAYEDLVEGDLVFSSSKGGEDSIDHVMLYCGDDTLIEAAMGVAKVQEISVHEKRKQFPNDEFFFGRYSKDTNHDSV